MYRLVSEVTTFLFLSSRADSYPSGIYGFLAAAFADEIGVGILDCDELGMSAFIGILIWVVDASKTVIGGLDFIRFWIVERVETESLVVVINGRG